MAYFVVDGAVCACPFGAAPGTLRVTSQQSCRIGGKAVATIQDAAPNINISAFGMCSSMVNPAVASATAAALGVLTPQPCTFAPVGLWTAMKPTVQIKGLPCLLAEAAVGCAVGQGTVKIVSPGQRKTMA